MPPKPLIKSARTRQVVLSLIMAGLLVASLAAASMLGGLRPVQVGDLALSVPRRWTGFTPTPSVGSEQLRVFRPKGDASFPLLLVWAHHPSSPADPEAILKLVRHSPVHMGLLATGLGPTPAGAMHHGPVEPIRCGRLVGVRQASIIYDQRIPQIARTRILAVLTLDGSRYWSISLSDAFGVEPATAARQLKQPPGDVALFDKICSTIDITGAEALSADQLAARFGIAAPAGLATPPTSSMLLLHPGAEPALRAIRLRRELFIPDADTTQATLSPEAMLANHLWRLTGEPPADEAITRQQQGDTDIWKISYPANAVARQLWYVRRTQAQAAAVMELVATEADLPATVAWAESVVDELQFSPDHALAGFDLSQALERGRELAEAQRAHMDRTHATGWSYWLEAYDGSPAGIGIAYGYLHEDEAGLPLRSTEKRLMTLGYVGDEDVGREARLFVSEISQDAATARDGSRMQIQLMSVIDQRILERIRAMKFRDGRRSPTPTPPGGAGGAADGTDDADRADEADDPAETMPINVETLVLDAGRLTAGRQEAQGMARTWSMQAPPAYLLPTGEDVWPIEPIKATSGSADAPGALVWMSRSTAPPTVCRLWAQPTDDGGVRLTIRPLLAMEADRLLLDATGRVVRGTRVEHATWSRLRTFRQTDRDSLLAAYPELTPRLHAWESQIEQNLN